MSQPAPPPNDPMASWVQRSHTHGSHTHDVYGKGAGPGVVIIHELPGLTREVIAFAEEVVAAGYTVALPHLFGAVAGKESRAASAQAFRQVCVSGEFTKIALGVTAPLAGWLQSLARTLHAEAGGPGVGALGMCFTGGFALAMMLDDAVVAPVLAQPAVPFPIDRARRADVNLNPADLARVAHRVRAGCPVLALAYPGDPAVGTRFTTLRRALGDNFIEVPLTGKGHATLTRERSPQAVDAVLAFFADRLRPPPA